MNPIETMNPTLCGRFTTPGSSAMSPTSHH
jgi:hypothetical protein